MSLYAISFLLNHDSYLLHIRSDVIIFVCFCDRRRGRDWKRMESMKIRLEIEQDYTLTPKVSKHATMARGVLVSRDRDAPAAAHCQKTISFRC